MHTTAGILTPFFFYSDLACRHHGTDAWREECLLEHSSQTAWSSTCAAFCSGEFVLFSVLHRPRHYFALLTDPALIMMLSGRRALRQGPDWAAVTQGIVLFGKPIPVVLENGDEVLVRGSILFFCLIPSPTNRTLTQ